MHGSDKIKGNARIADKIPKLVINVTIMEEDLFQTTDKNGKMRFTIKKRGKPDKYKNEFCLTESPILLDANENIARVTSRTPVFTIDVLLLKVTILKREFQKLRNANGFLKMHLIEEESKNSHFKILPGYFNINGSADRR